MFAQTLDGLANGSIIPKEQPSDPALSLRCFPRLPRDSEIDWHKSAEELARLVRASAEPFAGAYSYIGTEKVTIWRVHPEKLGYPYLGTPGKVAWRRRKTGEVGVLTGDGLLVLEEIEMPSKGRGRASDLIKSMRTRLGMDVAAELARLSHKIAELRQFFLERESLKSSIFLI